MVCANIEYQNKYLHTCSSVSRLPDDDDDDDDCLSLMSTQKSFHHIGTDSLCCFCQRLLIKSMEVEQQQGKTV